MKNLNKYFHFIFCSVLILLLIFLLNILIGNFIPENKRINKIKENTCLIISNEILNEFFMFDSDTLKILSRLLCVNFLHEIKFHGKMTFESINPI